MAWEGRPPPHPRGPRGWLPGRRQRRRRRPPGLELGRGWRSGAPASGCPAGCWREKMKERCDIKGMSKHVDLPLYYEYGSTNVKAIKKRRLN